MHISLLNLRNHFGRDNVRLNTFGIIAFSVATLYCRGAIAFLTLAFDSLIIPSVASLFFLCLNVRILALNVFVRVLYNI